VPKRVTLAEIAARVGVSATTVSLVLNDKPNSRVGEETRERVLRAARDLGYRPNATARALQSGRSDTIGFLSDEVTVTRFASSMIRGILDTGRSRNQGVLIAEAGTHPGAMTEALDNLLHQPVDALVVGLMRCRLVDLPPGGHDLPRVIANGMADGVPAVVPDEYAAGHAAARHLIDAGHRRIALVGRPAHDMPPGESTTVPRRMAGIDDAMAAAGLAFTGEHRGAEWEPALGYEGGHAVLDPGHDRPTAVLAANDRVAFGVYRAAAELGLDIPADLSVMSFDDEPLAEYLHPRATTMHLPYRAIGETAVSLAIDLAHRRITEAPAETLIPMPLVERDSVTTPRH
jgi:LacI family transcriptional regulator